jgi:hypothetical protein
MSVLLRVLAPRPADDILADYADRKIDFHFFDVEAESGRSINQMMVKVFKECYDGCQTRRRNFSNYPLGKHYDPKQFFANVIHGISKSVLTAVQSKYND